MFMKSLLAAPSVSGRSLNASTDAAISAKGSPSSEGQTRGDNVV